MHSFCHQRFFHNNYYLEKEWGDGSTGGKIRFHSEYNKVIFISRLLWSATRKMCLCFLISHRLSLIAVAAAVAAAPCWWWWWWCSVGPWPPYQSLPRGYTFFMRFYYYMCVHTACTTLSFEFYNGKWIAIMIFMIK